MGPPPYSNFPNIWEWLISDNTIVVHSVKISDVATIKLKLFGIFLCCFCQLAIIERSTEAVRKRLSSNNLHLIFAAFLICFSTFAQVNQPKVSIWANCITKRAPNQWPINVANLIKAKTIVPPDSDSLGYMYWVSWCLFLFSGLLGKPQISKFCLLHYM